MTQDDLEIAANRALGAQTEAEVATTLVAQTRTELEATLTPFFAVGHPTAPRGSTLGGDEDGVNDMTSAAHEDVTLNAVTRSKTKKALATPDIAASPLATWTARKLIDPGNAGVPVAANYAPKIRQRRCFGDAVDKQKEIADKRGRKNMATFESGDQVLLSTDGFRSSAVTSLGASKLAPRFIGPFRVMKVNGEAYTLDIPTSLRRRLKMDHAATIPSTKNPPALEAGRNANSRTMSSSFEGHLRGPG
ncbi:hypothetical protein PF005_g4876 [Phytophthora fragariae]|uniref:Tf2-1-like SH3-like domain-containing protein n=1 Tax=Phytophthora fragariae TaxID=53985 RepID=A0A6A3YZI0_9STRA|nr:hypothetical protein PF005_g4876 [Phytophthora fragariae]